MELTDEMTAEIAAKAVAEYQAKEDKKIVNRFTPGGQAEETTGFKSLGEQLHAVMRAKTGGGEDPRLKAIVGNSEGVPADGGYNN